MDKAPPQLLSAAAATAPADAVLRCQAALLAREGLAEAATALAAELATLLRCTRVSVGLLEGERLRVAGSSQVADLDPRHDTAAALVAAMHESIDQGLAVCWPPLAAQPPVGIAQRQLAGAGHACSVPLVAQGRAIGALTLERSDPPAFTAAEIALCEDAASFAGPVLLLKQEREAPWHARALQRLRGRLATRSRKRTAWAGAVVILALLLAVPLP